MMSKAKSIVNKKLEDFEKLKVLLESNMGYIGTFTEYLFCENVSYDDLVNLYCDLKELKLKSVSIDITKYDHEKLIDEIIKSKEDLLINSFKNKLPSLQKSFIENVGYMLLLKAIRKDNIDTFISKVSRYKTATEMDNALSVFCNSSNDDNKKEILTERLKDLKSEIIYDKDNYVIVLVDNYEDIQILANDTSWCIVTNKHQWNVYTKNSRQFILYDYNLDMFNPDFKIGFTCRNESIYVAHDILDTTRTNYIKQLIVNNIDIDVAELSNYNRDKEEPYKLGYTVIHKEFGFGKITEVSLNHINIVFSNHSRRFNLLNNLESIIVYNKPIKKTTPIKDWKIIIPYLPEKDAEELLVKFLGWYNKSFSANITISKMLVDRMLLSREYVSIDYLINVDKRLEKVINILGLPKVYDKKELPPSYSLSFKSFFRAFQDGFWSDTVIRKTCNSKFLEGILPYYEMNVNIGELFLEKIYTKLISIYNESDKFFNKEYEAVLMIMGRFLKKELPQSIEKNYNIILMKPSLRNIFENYREIVELPIDLNKCSGLNIEHTKFIIRKDYGIIDMSPYFGKKGYSYGYKRNVTELEKYESILNRLEGHSLTIVITRDQLKKFKSDMYAYRADFYKENHYDFYTYINSMKIYNMLYTLADKKKIMLDSFVTDEEEKVKIIVK